MWTEQLRSSWTDETMDSGHGSVFLFSATAHPRDCLPADRPEDVVFDPASFNRVHFEGFFSVRVIWREAL